MNRQFTLIEHLALAVAGGLFTLAAARLLGEFLLLAGA